MKRAIVDRDQVQAIAEHGIVRSKVRRCSQHFFAFARDRTDVRAPDFEARRIRPLWTRARRMQRGDQPVSKSSQRFRDTWG
jgi:hypothetical protein